MTSTLNQNMFPSPAYRNKGPYIPTPPTTDFSLVFEFDRKHNKFDRSFYSPALTHGRASLQQIDSFLGEAERILKKKIGPVRKLLAIFAFFAIAGFTAFFLLMLSMMTGDLDYGYYDDTSDDSIIVNNGDTLDDTDALLIALLGYLGGLIFYSILFSVYRSRRYRKAKKAINTLVERYSPVFAAQGLRWNIPKHFRWVELWKDYREQAQCVCGGQMLQQTYGNFVIPIQGQMVQQPQYQAFPQQNQQQLQIQYQPQPVPVPQNITNALNNQNRPLSQPLLNQGQNREISQYVPPNQNNYPSFNN
jgi:hypothetical protein